MTAEIIINVHGGVVQDVFCNDPSVRVRLVDWDSEGRDPSDAGIVEIADENGRQALAYVADYPVNPFGDLGGTDVERAIKAHVKR